MINIFIPGKALCAVRYEYGKEIAPDCKVYKIIHKHAFAKSTTLYTAEMFYGHIKTHQHVNNKAERKLFTHINKD